MKIWEFVNYVIPPFEKITFWTINKTHFSNICGDSREKLSLISTLSWFLNWYLIDQCFFPKVNLILSSDTVINMPFFRNLDDYNYGKHWDPLKEYNARWLKMRILSKLKFLYSTFFSPIFVSLWFKTSLHFLGSN